MMKKRMWKKMISIKCLILNKQTSTTIEDLLVMSINNEEQQGENIDNIGER